MKLVNKVICSIVIYKHSYAELKLTLDSLIACPSVHQIILVDNDVSDWAPDYLHSKVRYLNANGNFGFGYGHNLAINLYAQQSQYFLICNPDICFESSSLESMIRFADSRTEGLFLPRIVYRDGNNQFGARLLPSPLNLFIRRFSPIVADKLDNLYLLKQFDHDNPIFAPYLHGCFMLFKSQSLIALKGFDERFFMYMEDVDISRRCAEQFGNIYYPQVHVIHAHEQGSYKNKTLLKAHLKSAWQYFNKWGWFYDPNRQRLNDRCMRQLNQK